MPHTKAKHEHTLIDDPQDVFGDINRANYGDSKTKGIATLAKQHRMSGYELSIRWILYHSQLDGAKDDAIIVAARRPEKLEDTLARIVPKGQLEDEVVEKMDEIGKGSRSPRQVIVLGLGLTGNAGDVMVHSMPRATYQVRNIQWMYAFFARAPR